jgi:hypothetical protein
MMIGTYHIITYLILILLDQKWRGAALQQVMAVNRSERAITHK